MPNDILQVGPLFRGKTTNIAAERLRAMFDVGYFPPNTPPVE
jgi:hypothetical protein